MIQHRNTSSINHVQLAGTNFTDQRSHSPFLNRTQQFKKSRNNENLSQNNSFLHNSRGSFFTSNNIKYNTTQQMFLDHSINESHKFIHYHNNGTLMQSQQDNSLNSMVQDFPTPTKAAFQAHFQHIERARTSHNLRTNKRQVVSQCKKLQMRDELLLEDCLNQSLQNLNIRLDNEPNRNINERKNQMINSCNNLNANQLRVNTQTTDQGRETNMSDYADLNYDKISVTKILKNLELNKLRENKWVNQRMQGNAQKNSTLFATQNFCEPLKQLNQTQILRVKTPLLQTVQDENINYKRNKKEQMEQGVECASNIFDLWVQDYKLQTQDQEAFNHKNTQNEIQKVDTDNTKLPLSYIILNILSIGLAPDHITLDQMLKKDKEKNKRNYEALSKNIKNNLMSGLLKIIKGKSEKQQKRATIGDLSEIITTKLSNLAFLKKNNPQTLQYLIDYETDDENENSQSKLMKFIKRCSISKIQRKIRETQDQDTAKTFKLTSINDNLGETSQTQSPLRSPNKFSPQQNYLKRRTKVNQNFLQLDMTETNNLRQIQEQQEEFVNRLKMANKYYYERERIKREIRVLKKQIVHYEIMEDLKNLNILVSQMSEFERINGASQERLIERRKLQTRLCNVLRQLKLKYGKECRNLLLTVITLIPSDFDEIEDLQNSTVLPLMQLIISMLSEKLEKEEKALRFPNEDIGNMFQIVEKWWSQLDPKKLQLIQRETIEQFLIQKKILNNPKELDSIIRSFYPSFQPFNETTFKKSMFIRIMYCAIMRGVLLNLNHFMQIVSGDIQKEELSLSMKVLRLQRLILVSGIKAKSNIGVYHNGKIQSEGLSMTCAKIINSLQNLRKYERNGEQIKNTSLQNEVGGFQSNFKQEKAKIEKDIQALQKINREFKIESAFIEENKPLTKTLNKENLSIFSDEQNSDQKDEALQEESDDSDMFQYCDRFKYKKHKNPMFESLESQDFEELINDEQLNFSNEVQEKMQIQYLLSLISFQIDTKISTR
eukprot:403346824